MSCIGLIIDDLITTSASKFRLNMSFVNNEKVKLDFNFEKAITFLHFNSYPLF